MRTLLILTAVSVLSSLPALADSGTMMSKSATVNSMAPAKKADHRMKPAKAKNAMMGSPHAMSGMAPAGDAMKPTKADQH